MPYIYEPVIVETNIDTKYIPVFETIVENFCDGIFTKEINRKTKNGNKEYQYKNPYKEAACLLSGSKWENVNGKIVLKYKETQSVLRGQFYLLKQAFENAKDIQKYEFSDDPDAAIKLEWAELIRLLCEKALNFNKKYKAVKAKYFNENKTLKANWFCEDNEVNVPYIKTENKNWTVGELKVLYNQLIKRTVNTRFGMLFN